MTDIKSMLLAESRHNLVGGPRHGCPVAAACLAAPVDAAWLDEGRHGVQVSKVHPLGSLLCMLRKRTAGEAGMDKGVMCRGAAGCQVSHSWRCPATEAAAPGRRM